MVFWTLWQDESKYRGEAVRPPTAFLNISEATAFCSSFSEAPATSRHISISINSTSTSTSESHQSTTSTSPSASASPTRTSSRRENPKPAARALRERSMSALIRVKENVARDYIVESATWYVRAIIMRTGAPADGEGMSVSQIVDVKRESGEHKAPRALHTAAARRAGRGLAR
ncbi:hypothetical protein HETIRDRAFT_103697 [Heterobasidion irregulare TC 32-1]|uniref:Uncharacterized protein n=1 Tax=Heterobasidion irregulare (strain TC 32-1) TaxID=747525 RepID=W4K1I2_HETIT|nr:uncharacterized protein HETIRDRAFT_103697 [Heterobasidion irregulare TC 32-1]ETW79683.1 hypothetical protein HETIRDRAFT_103697 [Heterobasidion irregulare TC 32-1]